MIVYKSQRRIYKLTVSRKRFNLYQCYHSWYTPNTKATANSELLMKLHSAKLSFLSSQQHTLPTLMLWPIFGPMCVTHTILYRSNPRSLTWDLTSSEICRVRSRQIFGSYLTLASRLISTSSAILFTAAVKDEKQIIRYFFSLFCQV